MTQKYISIMDKIDRSHKMFNALPCMEFDYSINPYLGYWYAEERLYILQDCMVNAYYFIEAGSPKEAIEKVLKKVEEAEHAGEWVEEKYE
jgi:hypothetical protein